MCASLLSSLCHYLSFSSSSTLCLCQSVYLSLYLCLCVSLSAWLAVSLYSVVLFSIDDVSYSFFGFLQLLQLLPFSSSSSFLRRFLCISSSSSSPSCDYFIIPLHNVIRNFLAFCSSTNSPAPSTRIRCRAYHFIMCNSIPPNAAAAESSSSSSAAAAEAAEAAEAADAMRHQF